MSDKLQHSFSARGRVSTVSFKCRYKTSFGSSLFVVGNLKLLGDWNLNNAIALSTTPETYPVWTQKNAFSCPVGTEIIYKYFVKDNNGNITWEKLPNNANRNKIISKPGDFLIEDEENEIGEELEKTESYNKSLNDIKPKSGKKVTNTRKKGKKEESTKNESKKEEHKVTKKEEPENIKGKEKDKEKEEESEESKEIKIVEDPKILHKTKPKNAKKKKVKNQSTSGPMSSQGISNLCKVLDENTADDKDEILDINNSSIKENQNLIDLKINLDKNFKIKDLYTYDINLINKMNSGLFESFLFNSNQNITNEDRLVFVDEFLPFIVKKNENCPEDDEENRYILIPNNRYSIIQELVKNIKCKICWVGMLKNYEDFDENELEEIYAFLEEKMIFVVEVKKKLYEEYYIYYNNILIPTFIDNSISSDNEYNQNYNKYYNSFQLLNRKFAETLCKFADMNDLIMLNDMNLCFIPNSLALRNKLNWRIGIYIHLCFPSSDVFKAFPNSIDIMYSLILCDVIGFHIYQDARNFMTILERVFWIYPQIKNKGYITFDYLGKYSFIFIKYCGADNEKVMKTISNTENTSNELFEEKRKYSNYLNKYKKIINDKMSIINFDNAIEMTELILKFNSYKIYLNENIDQKGKIILIEILSYKNSYKENLDKIHEEVNKIKKEFGEDSIYYEEFNEDENNVSLEEQLAIFSLGNIFLLLQRWNKICSLVNLYLLVQNQNKLDKIFGVIINESNPISPKIRSIYKINPYNIEQILKGIDVILHMESPIRMENLKKDLSYINKHSKINFLQSYFGDLKLITSNKKDLNSIQFGLKNDFRVMKLRKNFVPLTANILQNKYNTSKCRLFFLDYEETLQSFIEKDNDNINIDDDDYIMNKHTPSEKLINVLKSLCNNPKNYVYIITGKPKKFLQEWFKDVKNLGFGGEYGYYYKEAQSQDDKIHTLISMKDWSWKKNAYTIIKQFELKTEGSRTKLRDSSISWNFANSDQYSGYIQASDLSIHLSYLFGNSPHLEVITGKDYVEIKPKDLNKGYFISFILKKYINEGKKPDYIFACGDDVSDEEMFKYLNFVNKQINRRMEENIRIITSTLDKKPSTAQYYVPVPDELLNLLDSLTSSKYN